MPDDETARLLNKIGQILTEDEDDPAGSTLLYAEVDWGYVAPSVFTDRGDHVAYREPDLDRLGRALLDLWKAQYGDKRWREIEYLVHGDEILASFTYPEGAEEEPFDLERREKIVTKHFGDKRIVYPPMPDDPDIMEYKL